MSHKNEIDPTIGALVLTREMSELREPSEAATCSVASARPDDPYSQLLHRGADDEVADDLWSVPWSDLMMVMFVLFAALLAVRNTNPDIEVRYRSQLEPLRRLRMLAAELADNRRCAYRVRSISTDNVALGLLRARERHVPHEIADVTCNGARIRFIKGSAPTVDQGEILQLSVDYLNRKRRAMISAKVVFQATRLLTV